MSRRLGILVLASTLGACGLIAGIEDIPDASAPADAAVVFADVGAKDAEAAESGPVAPDGAPVLPNCGAQRVVHLAAGNGGLAWFQLLWPVPMVITAPNIDYAIDDPKRFTSLGTVEHPLYMRALEGNPFWVGTGKSPLPSVFVAGSNETHTPSPTSTIAITGKNAIAYGAGLQRASLAPKVPALTIGTIAFGTAPGAPSVVNVADAKSAVTAVASFGFPEARLTPDPATASKWYSAGAPAKITTLAEQLLFAANAFKLGAVGTVSISTLRDDPHGAFVGGDATTMANDLAGILAGFYAELATSFEATCGADGGRLSLADNVVFVINGDTMKDPFVRNGWPDGTPANSNLVFVRSNGFTKPGWFGQLAPSTRTNFSPVTGERAVATAAESTAAAVNGLVYAISRGNAAAVTAFDSSPYAGVRGP